MENGDQAATATDQIIVSETNEQKENAHENPVNGHSEPDDSKTNGEPDKGSSEQPEDEPAKAEQTEPEESTPEPDEAKPELEEAAPVAVVEPVVRPKEPRQSVNGAEKEGKEKKQEGEGEEENPDTAVYLDNKGDYDEYKSEDIAEKREKALEQLVPGGTQALIHHFRQPREPTQEESFLWLSLFTLIFFSRIFGAIALYKSIKVRILHAEKNYKEEKAASEAAKKWNIVGMIFCLCWVILVIVVLKGVGLFDESVDE